MLKKIFVSPDEDDRKLNVFLILPSPCEGNLPVLDTNHRRLCSAKRSRAHSWLCMTNHFNPLEVHSNIADPQYGNFFGNTDRRFVLDFDILF
jgi:hypothetical protein